MNKTIGTCSICGGAVINVKASPWGGIIPPTLTCSSCGAVAATPKAPVIPMQPKPDMSLVTTLGTTLGAKPYKLPSR